MVIPHNPQVSYRGISFSHGVGMEAVSPAEISLASLRVDMFEPTLSLEGIKMHDVLVEKVRNEATTRVKLQQQKTAAYFNKKVRNKKFLVNDLVLQETAVSQPSMARKFKPTWEGPYKIIKIIGQGTYRLSSLDGTPINNTWNGVHLKKFYQ